jgi:hypothetical protein
MSSLALGAAGPMTYHSRMGCAHVGPDGVPTLGFVSRPTGSSLRPWLRTSAGSDDRALAGIAHHLFDQAWLEGRPDATAPRRGLRRRRGRARAVHIVNTRAGDYPGAMTTAEASIDGVLATPWPCARSMP